MHTTVCTWIVWKWNVRDEIFFSTSLDLPGMRSFVCEGTWLMQGQKLKGCKPGCVKQKTTCGLLDAVAPCHYLMYHWLIHGLTNALVPPHVMRLQGTLSPYLTGSCHRLQVSP
jgi:hypothetical protein